MIGLDVRSTALQAWRMRLAVGSCLLALVVLASYGTVLVILKGENLAAKAAVRYVATEKLAGMRGRIWDRHGALLASSVIEYRPYIDRRKYHDWVRAKSKRNRRGVVLAKEEEIAAAIGIAADDLRAKLKQRKTGRAYLGKSIPHWDKLAIDQRRLPLLGFEERDKRFWPVTEETAHVVGFTNDQNKGQAGVERSLDELLAPANGKLVTNSSRDRKLDLEIIAYELERAGIDVTLSIDERLMMLASRELERAVEHHAAQAGSLVLLDVQSGDILALTNYPSYNPNRSKDDPNARRNRAIGDIVEPGSTMKPFVAAFSLEQGLVSPSTLLPTERRMRVGRKEITEAHIRPNRDLTVAETIKESSNKGAVLLSQKLTKRLMWEGYSRFGFGQGKMLLLHGKQLKAEQGGRLRPYQKWNEMDKAFISFGYGISVNLLELARAYAVFASGGTMPSIGLELHEQRPPARRVIDGRIAAQLMAMLEEVTLDGTGKKARIFGYRVAGKTGTAQRLVDGVYHKDSHEALFVGIAPASRPRFVCAVLISDPKQNGRGGGSAAAPVFAQVMGQALRLYQVPPDNPFLVIAPNALQARVTP